MPLYRWATFVISHDLYSYAILMPGGCAYLVWLQWRALGARINSSGHVWGVLTAVVGGGFFAAWCMSPNAAPSSDRYQDQLALSTAAFVFLVVAAGFMVLGKSFVRAAAIPALLLACMVPLPVAAEQAMESMLQHASAPLAQFLFAAVGTPVLREGMVIHLPGFSLQVAPECSGSHSTVVLVLTTLFAGQLFFRRPWNRALLVLTVLPIALLRNAVRILVIGELCVHVGPEMIDSPIHHRGGPIFFALSLLPVFLLVFFLRRRENRAPAASPPAAS